jgi:flavin reductase (DIM6/NTAB) family NADH-FMN oxidoreductase RutF
MKREITPEKSKWILEPGCVVIGTTGTYEKANAMTFSWQTPVSSGAPCQILLVINPSRYSYELLKKNGEITVNVPGESLLAQVHLFGSISGRDKDKIAESGLRLARAGRVGPPLIADCPANLECRLSRVFSIGHHDLLLLEVVRALVETEVFDGNYLIPERFKTIHFLGGKRYGILERAVEAD